MSTREKDGEILRKVDSERDNGGDIEKWRNGQRERERLERRESVTEREERLGEEHREQPVFDRYHPAKIPIH